ncbi:trypsin-1-like [Panulirus ornatus]|uniref:trypsin-1-like n=1 Tax=Panulirus ornatus TaxID=150431 RepID=UPI003A8B12CE
MKTLVFCLLLVGALAAPQNKPRFRKGLNKIVGGTEATAGELPYQLSFQDTSYGFAFHFCGASIYNENYAICAGHCVQGEDMNDPDYLQVVAGELNQGVVEGNEQTVVLSKIILHEDYNAYTISNDISLLKLSQPLTMTDYVQAIPLPAPGHSASGECVVSGWGTTSEGGSSPNTLMKVSVPIVTDEECRNAYGESAIEDSMLCAGFPEGGKDSCQGDSGGPFACSDTGSTYLAGVVSWGYGCARPNYPGVYTEVSYFVDWIVAHAV